MIAMEKQISTIMIRIKVIKVKGIGKGLLDHEEPRPRVRHHYARSFHRALALKLDRSGQGAIITRREFCRAAAQENGSIPQTQHAFIRRVILRWLASSSR